MSIYRNTYFSSEKIRERYNKTLDSDSHSEFDPLIDIAKEHVKIMRHHNLSDNEIKQELKKRFHFEDEVIDKWVD